MNMKKRKKNYIYISNINVKMQRESDMNKIERIIMMNNRFTSKFKVRIRNPESSGGKIMTVEESSQLLFRGVFVFSFILAEIHGTGRRRDQPRLSVCWERN